MEQTLKVPEFKTERDEADWWFKNQDQVTQQFERAASRVNLGRETIARRGNTPTTTIRLDPEDIAKARVYAQRRGLKYQTYLKMLIHQALHKEELQGEAGVPPGTKRMSRMSKHSAPKGLSRDEAGEIRRKRSDTLIGTLRDEYGEEFAKGYRRDAKLGTVLDREGLDDLSQLLKKKRVRSTS